MKDLPRLLDETQSEAERALLQAGRSYRTSRETLAKTLAALGLAGSTAAVVTTTSTATAATLTPLAKLSGLKLLLSLSVVGVVAAVPIGYKVFYGVKPAVALSAVPRAADKAAELPAPLGGGRPADLLTAPTVTPVSKPAKISARSVGAPVRLGQELAALDAARSTLAQGNAQGAIFLLDGYDQTCPHGRLELEADLLRMEALARSGQSEGAKRRASAFLKRHPTSVLAARARGYLGE